MNKTVKPVPFELSSWDSGTEIFYLCPNCACDLRLLGHRQNYCYICGKKFDWKHLPKYCTKEFKERVEKLLLQYNNCEISYEEKNKKLNEMFFEIYEEACTKDRGEINYGNKTMFNKN